MCGPILRCRQREILAEACRRGVCIEIESSGHQGRARLVHVSRDLVEVEPLDTLTDDGSALWNTARPAEGEALTGRFTLDARYLFRATVLAPRYVAVWELAFPALFRRCRSLPVRHLSLPVERAIPVRLRRMIGSPLEVAVRITRINRVGGAGLGGEADLDRLTVCDVFIARVDTGPAPLTLPLRLAHRKPRVDQTRASVLACSWAPSDDPSAWRGPVAALFRVARRRGASESVGAP